MHYSYEYCIFFHSDSEIKFTNYQFIIYNVQYHFSQKKFALQKGLSFNNYKFHPYNPYRLKPNFSVSLQDKQIKQAHSYATYA